MKTNLPEVQLYSKKQIMDLAIDYIVVKYYCSADGEHYTAFIKDGKLFAKQYPQKKHFYLMSDLKSNLTLKVT